MKLRKAMSLRSLIAVAASTCGAALMVGAAGAPANAATIIESNLGMNVTATTTTAVVVVHLPMDRWDAQGYINNGARVEVRCFGDDPWFDNQLFATRVYTASTGSFQSDRLFADDRGVWLITAITYPRGGAFNEDTTPDNGDEVYCTGKWIDGNGSSLLTKTPTKSGTF